MHEVVFVLSVTDSVWLSENGMTPVKYFLKSVYLTEWEAIGNQISHSHTGILRFSFLIADQMTPNLSLS